MADHSERTESAFAPLLFRRVTVVRALKLSAIIGTLLILINQGNMLLAGEIPPYWKIALTYLVPYGVSSYSTAALLHERGD
ncbi:MAG: nitrate/nitrite transporter NrtS [Phycisphaerales bacterium]